MDRGLETGLQTSRTEVSGSWATVYLQGVVEHILRTLGSVCSTTMPISFPRMLFTGIVLLQLCSVTLELFYVLVDLNCEDVMLELIFK